MDLFHIMARNDLYCHSYTDRSNQQPHKLLHDDTGSQTNICGKLGKI